MAETGFRSRINQRRRFHSPPRVEAERDILRVFESGRGRTANSPTIRCPQQKIQVLPLERNAMVCTHLTYSLEVQQVGRYIAKGVLSKLKGQELLEEYSLGELTGLLENVVGMTCLVHDIGNPPFGRFGGAAINDWSRQRLAPGGALNQPLIDDRCETQALRLHEREATLNMLRHKVRQDLCSFEGNAQGIRPVHTLVQMNLIRTQVGCVLEYTRPAWWLKVTPASHNYLMEGPGCYLAEEKYVTRLCKELDLAPYNRSPLIWIMEVTDDILYCVADPENAVEKHTFSAEQLYQHLYGAWGNHEEGSLFSQVVGNTWGKSRANYLRQSAGDQFFIYLRVNTLDKLVPYAARRFIDNPPAISTGDSNHAPLEDDSDCSQLLGLYGNVTVKQAFSHPNVEQLELQDYRVVSGLPDIYQLLLELSLEDLGELVAQEQVRRLPIVSQLYRKLSAHHQPAYVEAVSKLVRTAPESALMKYYYRYHLIQNYISGMTGPYVWDEYQRLATVEQAGVLQRWTINFHPFQELSSGTQCYKMTLMVTYTATFVT